MDGPSRTPVEIALPGRHTVVKKRIVEAGSTTLQGGVVHVFLQLSPWCCVLGAHSELFTGWVKVSDIRSWSPSKKILTGLKLRPLYFKRPNPSFEALSSWQLSFTLPPRVSTQPNPLPFRNQGDSETALRSSSELKPPE
jgi:hypothetical protein